MSVHTQPWHEKYNATTYPGTRQLCIKCGDPTERCEEDAIYSEGGEGPLCLGCYKNEVGMIEIGDKLIDNARLVKEKV
jgi:ferredoxin